MSGGPEHYREAERLLDMGAPEAEPRAQVHAILALAAAQIEAVASRGPGDIGRAWADVVWPTAKAGDA